MRYNSNYNINDIFASNKLVGVVPQLKTSEIANGKVSDRQIGKQCQLIINNVLGGKISGKNIEVSNMTVNRVVKLVEQCSGALEAIYGSLDSIVAGAKDSRKRLYISAVNLTQVATYTARKKVSFMQELVENLMYNPAFNNPMRMSPAEQARQEAWKKKVGYKE